jgi:hypothetical protein
MKIPFSQRMTGYLLSAVAAIQLFPAVSNAAVPNRATAARAAAAAPNSNPRVLPPGSSPHGKTYEEWSALWWQWFLPLNFGDYTACSIGRFESVAFLLTGPPTCAGSIPTGTTLFFPIATVECSSLEPIPFFGDTPIARRTCAEGFLPLLFGPGQTLAVEVDGVPIHNLTGYGATSTDFNFTITGPGNVFGIPCPSPPCTGQATGAGYYLMLAPLSPGTYTIHIVATGFGIDTTFTLSVTPGR